MLSANKQLKLIKYIFTGVLILSVLLLLCACGSQLPEEADEPVISDAIDNTEPADGSPENAENLSTSESDCEPLSQPVSETITEPEASSQPEAKPETHPQPGQVIVPAIEPEIIPEPESETAPEPEVLHDPVTLMYHLIMAEPYTEYTSLFVHPDDFSHQLDILNSRGYQYLFSEEYHQTTCPSVILTFDDGYEDNYTTMFPILKEKGAKATIFMVSDFIDQPGYLTKDQIIEMAQSGYVSFQSHTKSHAELNDLSEKQLHEEFSTVNAAIETITGRPVTTISYPKGMCNTRVDRVLRSYYDFGYTILPPNPKASFNAYRMPRYNVTRGLDGDDVLNMITK